MKELLELILEAAIKINAERLSKDLIHYSTSLSFRPQSRKPSLSMSGTKLENKLTQLNVAFTYQKSAPTCNCGHFVFGGFRNDYGFARDNVELYIDKGENMRGRKW